MSDLVVPITGEVIAADDAHAAATALDTVSELLGMLHEARRGLIEILVDEAQRQGTKTLHLDDATVKLSGGTKTRWDVDKLRELEQAGLPAARVTAFLRPVVTYKPDGRVARQLAGANPDYARIIDEARIEEPAPWSARVERRGDHEHALPAATGHEHDA